MGVEPPHFGSLARARRRDMVQPELARDREQRRRRSRGEPPSAALTGVAVTPAMWTVFEGRELRGFILPRGRTGFEAFDRDLVSLGLFETAAAAACVIESKEIANGKA